MDNGGFYDAMGYLFNNDGYDEFGGFYDQQTGYYIPGEDYRKEYEENFGLATSSGQYYLEGEDLDEGEEMT